MKSVLLIGLGLFGRHIAKKLNELGHEVMAIDKKEELVNEVLPYVTNAQIGDSTNEEFLTSLCHYLMNYLDHQMNYFQYQPRTLTLPLR